MAHQGAIFAFVVSNLEQIKSAGRREFALGGKGNSLRAAGWACWKREAGWHPSVSMAFASCRKMLQWIRVATLLGCSALDRALVSNNPRSFQESRPADLVAPDVPLLTCYSFPARLWDDLDESRKQRPEVDGGWEFSCGSGRRKRRRAGGREACRRDQQETTCGRDLSEQSGIFRCGEEPQRRAEGAEAHCWRFEAQSRVWSVESWCILNPKR